MPAIRKIDLKEIYATHQVNKQEVQDIIESMPEGFSMIRPGSIWSLEKGDYYVFTW